MLQQVLAAAKKGEETTDCELELTTSSGEIMALLMNTAPRYDEEGKFIGSLCVGQDITKRREVEHKLVTVANDLQKVFHALGSISMAVTSGGFTQPKSRPKGRFLKREMTQMTQSPV